MEIDVQGSHSVASLIEQSGLSKFTVARPGSHRNSPPIYEYLKGNNNSNAVAAFKQWAQNVLAGGGNSNTYEIFLFDEYAASEPDQDQDPVSEGKKKKARAMRFTFALSNYGMNSLPVVNGIGSQDVETAVKLALAERDKQDQARVIADLTKRLEALEAEPDEEEDEEEDEVGSLGALEKLSQILQMAGLGGGKPSAAPAINGAPETQEKLSQDQIKNINRAIGVLYKYDPNIDQDLLKLAGIAQSNPTQFEFLLNALRTM